MTTAERNKRIRLILLAILAAIVVFALVAFVVNELGKNPFSFQEIVTLGEKYQEYSPKSPDLDDDQRQIRIKLPASDPDYVWEAVNHGCMVLTSTTDLINAKPIEVVNTNETRYFEPGQPLFISCTEDARIYFIRTIPVPEVPVPVM